LEFGIVEIQEVAGGKLFLGKTCGSPTKNKTDESPKFRCKNMRFFIYTIFFVVNRHNAREYTFFINKITHENFWLGPGKPLNIHSFSVNKYQN